MDGKQTAPAIELNDVGRTFADGTVGIAGVSLSIMQGEFVAIVGPSGSGKSTLLNILGLLDRPSSGQYFLTGEDTATLTQKEADVVRGSRIGFVFQSAHILSDATVLENATLGLVAMQVPKHQRRRLARQQLKEVGLLAFADQEARLLSGGQRQRLATARALAGKPTLVLADEPTGSLDTENGWRVISLLRRAWTAGSTVVVITHDSSIAQAADRVITISDGQISSDIRTAAPSGYLVSTPQGDNSHSPPREGSGPSLPKGRGVLQEWTDTWSESFRNLTNRVLRTSLLVSAFALGIGGLIAASSMSLGAAAQVDDRLVAAGSNSVTATLRLDPTELVNTEPLVAAEARLQKLDHVRTAGFAVIRTPDTVDIRRAGVPSESSARDVGLMVASPSYLDVASRSTSPSHLSFLRSDHPAALIPEEAADDLGIGLDEAGLPARGSQLWINGKLVPVLGTLNAGPESPQLRNSVVVNPGAFHGLSADEAVFTIVTDPGYPAAVAASTPVAISAANPADVQTRTVADLRSTRSAVANDLSYFITVLSAVLLVLASISAAAVTTLFVHARTHEIALRRALGTSRAGVAALFLVEGSVVGLAGGVAGCCLGSLAAVAFGILQGWPVLVPSWALPTSILLGALTGFVSAAYPAWIASRKDPAIALRE